MLKVFICFLILSLARLCYSKEISIKVNIIFSIKVLEFLFLINLTLTSKAWWYSRRIIVAFTKLFRLYLYLGNWRLPIRWMIFISAIEVIQCHLLWVIDLFIIQLTTGWFHSFTLSLLDVIEYHWSNIFEWQSHVLNLSRLSTLGCLNFLISLDMAWEISDYFAFFKKNKGFIVLMSAPLVINDQVTIVWRKHSLWIINLKYWGRLWSLYSLILVTIIGRLHILDDCCSIKYSVIVSRWFFEEHV